MSTPAPLRWRLPIALSGLTVALFWWGIDRALNPAPTESLPPYRPSGAKVSCQRTRVLGIGCHVVRIPTDPPGCCITFVAAKSHKTRHLSFRRLIHRSPVPPQVAVAGTFFDKRTYAPTGEIIVDRKRIDFGGVGVPRRGQEVILLVTQQNISLRTFSQMFLTLGCQDALNLDGGGSLSLFYRNRVLIAPGRELTNIVVAF